ncbi:MAG: hypothetical protein ACQEXN_03900 [Actinomycetota bacterium]
MPLENDLPHALTGCIPFNAVGDPVEIWTGDLGIQRPDGRKASAPGKVQLLWRSGLEVKWHIHPGFDDDPAWAVSGDRDPSSLTFDLAGRPAKLNAHIHRHGEGWISGGSLGRPEGLDHVIAHWVNLPHLHGKPVSNAKGTEAWAGRFQMQIREWSITIDARPNLSKVYADAKRQHSFALTHVMELRRADSAIFDAPAAKELLEALHYGVSFALGRWSSPAIRVGLTADGVPQWTEWAPVHTDHPAKGSLGWWNKTRAADLEEALLTYANRWSDPKRQRSLRFLTTSAILAMESGFVEQRIMTAVAALKHLSWVTEILEAEVPEAKWMGFKTSKRLRRLLDQASIGLGVSPENSPRLAEYAKHANIDGPEAVTRIRHALTHPKDTADIYEVPGLIAEAARLATRYLNLGTLYWLGYTGSVVDGTKRGGWYGQSDLVPWVNRQGGASVPA